MVQRETKFPDQTEMFINLVNVRKRKESRLIGLEQIQTRR